MRCEILSKVQIELDTSYLNKKPHLIFFAGIYSFVWIHRTVCVVSWAVTVSVQY